MLATKWICFFLNSKHNRHKTSIIPQILLSISLLSNSLHWDKNHIKVIISSIFVPAQRDIPKIQRNQCSEMTLIAAYMLQTAHWGSCKIWKYIQVSPCFTRKKFNLLQKRFRKEAEAGGWQIQGQYRLPIKTGSPDGKTEGEKRMDTWKKGRKSGWQVGRQQGRRELFSSGYTVVSTFP